MNVADTFPVAREQKIIAMLCLLAAVHVFVYAAAFPFFNNVDELSHFDLVVKYARCEFPRKFETVDHQSAVDRSLYGANFYLETGTNDGEWMPQPWKLTPDQQAQWFQVSSPIFRETNYESSQPPLYYAMAAVAWRLLGALGLDEGWRLYGLHFLNIPIVVLLVWLSWVTAREIFPEQFFPRIAVPALLACMPQSAFYSIQNDVLSPLCFGAAFLGLLRLFHAETPGWRLGALTGLALAAAFLTKMTNLPLLGMALASLACHAAQRARCGKLRPSLPALGALGVCALLPALPWIVWCRLNFGDFTGSSPKVLFWGWTAKPFLDWFHHPIFSLHGAWIYFSEFLSEFWQGEMSWHHEALCLHGVKLFYDLLNLSLLVVALFKLVHRPPPSLVLQYWSLRFACLLCAVAVSFLIYISISFDFHGCLYPSRAYPYLVSGRLALGALIPWLLLMACGLEQILARTALALKLFALGTLLFMMLVAEFATNGPAFNDAYNLYHF